MGDLYNIDSQSELVHAIKANDSAALKTLYTSCFQKTEAWILKNNGTEAQAKDIYQDSFIVVWQNIKEDKFIPQNETALQGYLYTISKNKWMDYLRSKHYKKTVATSKIGHFDVAGDLNVQEEDDILKANRLVDVMEAFKQMKAPCKQLLTTFYFEKKSLRDIANALQIEETTARNKKYRCMERLREMVLASKS